MLVFVQLPQHKSTPDPVAAQKNIPFGTIFIEFGDTKKCCTFAGFELAPKSSKIAYWRSQLNAQKSQMHSIHLGPIEKNPFLQKHKEGAICSILREKTHFWPPQRLKKVLLTAQGCAIIIIVIMFITSIALFTFRYDQKRFTNPF